MEVCHFTLYKFALTLKNHTCLPSRSWSLLFKHRKNVPCYLGKAIMCTDLPIFASKFEILSWEWHLCFCRLFNKLINNNSPKKLSLSQCQRKLVQWLRPCSPRANLSSIRHMHRQVASKRRKPKLSPCFTKHKFVSTTCSLATAPREKRATLPMAMLNYAEKKM